LQPCIFELLSAALVFLKGKGAKKKRAAPKKKRANKKEKEREKKK
jgi:hypothetical protein